MGLGRYIRLVPNQSRKGARKTPAMRVAGLDRRPHEHGPCGLCGTVGSLTKTHIPSRAAGHTGLVTRRTMVSISRDGSQTVRDSAPRMGGIHFYGLCESCNQLQNLYDGAYVELVDIALPWITSGLVLPDGPRQPPTTDLRPGAVARSVLIPMFGLNANLRNIYPDVASALLMRSPSVTLPADLALRLAIAAGVRARVTGAIGGFEMFGRRLDNEPLGIMTQAQVHFPPLSWHLAPRERSLLDLQGWADVTAWLERAPQEQARFSDVCGPLPVVLLPRHDEHGNLWCEVFSDEITFNVHSDDVSPGFRRRSA